MKLKKVEVIWEDIVSGNSDWIDPSKAIEEAEKRAICYSVGYILKETKERIILVQSISYEDLDEIEEVSDTITIPKKLISEMNDL